MKNNLVACIKVDGKVMREFKNVVRVPFGKEYSIFLKNLSAQRASVKITIDGDDVLNGHSLMVGSHSQQNLKRWVIGGMSVGPCLKFVEKTEEVRETRPDEAMAGLVVISYQFEARRASMCLSRAIDDCKMSAARMTGPVFKGPDISTTEIDSSRRLPWTQTETYCSAGAEITADVNDDGITIQGQDIVQEFAEVYLGELEIESHTISFQLKGGVHEAINVNTKKKCSKCNKLNKFSYKFCVACGNKLSVSLHEYCRTCGTLNEGTNAYCLKCGTTFNAVYLL